MQSFHLPLFDWLMTNLQDNVHIWRDTQWNCFFAVLLWSIWKIRCRRIFSSEEINVSLQPYR